MSRYPKNAVLERMAQYIVEPEMNNSCTDWSGGCDQDGYPMFWYNGKTRRASRVLWETVYGPIPEGLIVRHKCDNPKCLQAEHLLLGTHKDNTGDALRRGRMRGPRKVESEIRKQINEERAKGVKVATIARKLNISVSSVYSYLDPDLIKDGNYARGTEHWNSRK